MSGRSRHGLVRALGERVAPTTERGLAEPAGRGSTSAPSSRP